MKRMPKKITVDELAAMTKEGFERLEKILQKFATREETNKQFRIVHRRLDELEENTRSLSNEQDVCRKHRALTDARLRTRTLETTL